MKIRSTFLQKDLGVASFMIARSCQYVGLHPIGGNTFAFEFDDTDGQCSDLSQAYWRGDTCSGEKIVAALKFLKTELQKSKNIENSKGRNSNGILSTKPTAR